MLGICDFFSKKTERYQRDCTTGVLKLRTEIKNITCVGSGLIGQGWATLFAAAGYGVIMQDISDDKLHSALEQVQVYLGHLADNDRLQGQTAADAHKLIRTTPSLAEAVKDADYILESVPDKYSAKKPVFKEMDALAPPDTILASSSSGLLMSEIQTAVTRPERCVLVHPFLPVHLLPLVEVVGGGSSVPGTCAGSWTRTRRADLLCQFNDLSTPGGS